MTPLCTQNIQQRLKCKIPSQHSTSPPVRVDHNNEIICSVPIFGQLLKQADPLVKMYSIRETTPGNRKQSKMLLKHLFLSSHLIEQNFPRNISVHHI